VAALPEGASSRRGPPAQSRGRAAPWRRTGCLGERTSARWAVSGAAGSGGAARR